MLEIMRQNKDVVIIFCGLGYPRFEEFSTLYPDRAINSEASEQTALDMAVGLAYSGKVPFIYTITPFLLRGFETIRSYINHEKLHVILIGAGRDDDYSKDDGYSHDANDIGKILNTQENITQYYPHNIDNLQHDLIEALHNNEPSFISLRR